MVDVFLIRHAERIKINGMKIVNESSQLNDEKIILTEKGEKQAKEISNLEQLKNLDVLWCSNYVRAMATAKYIANKYNLKINIDERLNERKRGDLEKLKEFGKDKKNTFSCEQLLDKKLKIDGGESNIEVAKRMQDSIYKILEENEAKRVAIVSHGASIKFFLTNEGCTFNEDFNIVFKNKIFEITSPCVLHIKFDNKRIIDIEQIYLNKEV